VKDWFAAQLAINDAELRLMVRRGELLALRISDVDLEPATLSINRVA
jgi:integrase